MSSLFQPETRTSSFFPPRTASARRISAEPVIPPPDQIEIVMDERTAQNLRDLIAMTGGQLSRSLEPLRDAFAVAKIYPSSSHLSVGVFGASGRIIYTGDPT